MDSSAQLKRARRLAIVLATASIIYALAFIYAWLQKSEAEKQIQALTEELEHCKQEKK